MPIFPLDSVRNAAIDRDLEPILEEIRENLARFPFAPEDGDAAEFVKAYDVTRPRLNVLASLLRGTAGTGADISTGLGFVSVVLARLGVQVVATETDVALARFAAAQGIEVRPYTIGRAAPPFEPGSLDFVVFSEVLEHLKLAPVAVLSELAGLLRPGGRLLLTTPNVASLSHIQALAAGENFLEPFPESLPPDADPTDQLEHVREYSVREVADAAEAAGLAVEQVLMTGWGELGYDPLPSPYANEIIVLVATR